MKTLGLIGGMSWESTIEYYRVLNQLVKERLGKWNSAKILLYSLNFEEILPLQNEGRWEEIASEMIEIAKNLEIAGSNALVICSNTAHKVADQIQKQIRIPLIHVVDETAKIIKCKKIKKVGLLGTKFTMEDGFYTDRLVNNYDIEVLLPEKRDRDLIHDAIYNEFAQGIFKKTTKEIFLNIIEELSKNGAKGIILGCTEIPLIIKQQDVKIQLYNTLEIHLKAAVNFALQ